MQGDGDGYIECALGHTHWGRYGAAGALLRLIEPRRHSSPHIRYLLTHRSPEVHEGDCWGIPGGALDSHETPQVGAFRETCEELDLAALSVWNVRILHHNDHGHGWSYTTVMADVHKYFDPAPAEYGWETVDVRWFPAAAIDELPLHSGFKQTWEQYQQQGYAV